MRTRRDLGPGITSRYFEAGRWWFIVSSRPELVAFTGGLPRVLFVRACLWRRRPHVELTIRWRGRTVVEPARYKVIAGT